MALKRLFQVCFAQESQPAVFIGSGLYDAANAKLQVIDPQLTYDVAEYERQIVRGTFSPLTSLSGVAEATFSFGVELAGTTAAGDTTAPVWGKLLEACAFQTSAVKAFGIAATFAGTSGRKLFEHGDTVTGAPSTATGTVMHDTWEGQTVMRVKVLTGTFAAADVLTTTITAGTVTVAISASGATPSGTPVDAGVTYWPTSIPEITVTVGSAGGLHSAGDLYKGIGVGGVPPASGAILKSTDVFTNGALRRARLMDGTIISGETFNNLSQAGTAVLSVMAQSRVPTLSMGLVEDGVRKTLKGCRGTVSMSSGIGEPIILQFEFKGTLTVAADGIAGITDGTAVTGVAYESPVPPKLLGAEIKVGGLATAGATSYLTEHTPRVTSLTLDYGGEVSIQKDATVLSGTVCAHVSGRAPTGSIDPEIRPENSFPFLDRLINGTTFRLRVRIGTALKNAFLITTPAAKPQSEALGDRDGIATRDLNFSFSGLKQDGTDGEDRELVISYCSQHMQF